FSGLAILSFAKYRIPFTIHHPLNAVYTADVGLGHVQAAECGRIGQRYLLANQNLNVPELAAIISRLAGVPGPRWHLSEPVVLFGAWIMEGIGFLTASEPLFPRKAVYAARVGQRLDSSKAQRELSLELTPIEEAIRRALAWFRQNGYL
ncbi:MAG: epimerase, partial [Candidatus Omnitrophica bacterium]|nr:epimerase [Candidatus Omnitrophota bacterium]